MDLINSLFAINIVLESLVIVRLWRAAQKAYSKFGIYLCVSTVTSILLLALNLAALRPYYQTAWILTELLMAFLGCFVSWEAFRNIRRIGRHLGDALIFVVAFAVATAIIAWAYAHYGYIYDKKLEQVFEIKATLEFFFSVLLGSMAFTGHIPHRMRSLEFRHAVLLAVYFLLNCFVFFGIGIAASMDKLWYYNRPLTAFMLATCTGCLVGWLTIFRRQRI